MTNKKSKYKSDDLISSCLTETTIDCTKCKESETIHNCDLYDAIDPFFEKGWRATSNHCYCPKCAKKYLKSQ